MFIHFSLKGALNPNFLNMSINKEKNLALETFWSHFLTGFVKKLQEDFTFNIHSKVLGRGVLLGSGVITQF